jgi:hypothetical protein
MIVNDFLKKCAIRLGNGAVALADYFIKQEIQEVTI